MTNSSQFTVHSSQFTVHSSRFTVDKDKKSADYSGFAGSSVNRKPTTVNGC